MCKLVLVLYMKIEKYILSKLSRDPDESDYETNSNNVNLQDPLELLKSEYSDFSNLVSNKHIVDYGCGDGRQTIALAEEENCIAYGIDTNRNTLDRAKSYAKNKKNVFFYTSIPKNLFGTFDIVISQNSMEHFPDPKNTLLDMKQLLNTNGKLLITFGPPWFAPYGSHMNFFCKVPYLNILFSEDAIMATRQTYRSDGAKRYEDIESGLNKMTLKKFETLIHDCDLSIDRITYRCVKKQNWLSRLPMIRELFVNHITCVISNN